jgi:hypothetical protein
MTTKRKLSKSISTTGVKFARDVVNCHNCIFQEVALENDIGNDAYIEFIQDEQPTGCCIFVQIKSGDSYVKKNGNYLFKTDKDHFEYWASHPLPIAVIVYGPTDNHAVWYDITEYLTQHPKVIETGPYIVDIPSSQEFSNKTFKDFDSHFHSYLEPYKHKFGVALQKFADRENIRNCQDGMKYLVTFQRQNIAGWYYIISCYRNYRRHPMLFYLTNIIAYLPGHEDVFWYKGNIIEEQTRKAALDFLIEIFGREEVAIMLEIVTGGGGFTRGAIGQSIFAIVQHVKNRDMVLEAILADSHNDNDVRYWALMLLVYFTQFAESGIEKCIKLVIKYQNQITDDDTIIMVSGIREELELNKRFQLFY